MLVRTPGPSIEAATWHCRPTCCAPYFLEALPRESQAADALEPGGPVDGTCASLSFRVDFPGVAPLAPAPFVSRDATKIGERGRSRNTQLRHAPNAVDHDEHGVGHMLFSGRPVAATARRDDPHCPPAECVQRYGGCATVRRPQAKPHSDTRGEIVSAGGRGKRRQTCVLRRIPADRAADILRRGADREQGPDEEVDRHGGVARLHLRHA